MSTRLGIRPGIRLDWSRLLGFDQIEASTRDLANSGLARVGDKVAAKVSIVKVGDEVALPKMTGIRPKVGDPKIGRIAPKVGETKTSA